MPQVLTRQTRRRSRRALHPHREAAVEAGMKLAVNGILAIAAVSALFKLIPYNLAYQEELQSFQTEVEALDQRVERLEASFNRRFDPQQARSIMQEQSNRVEPTQVRVIFVEPDHANTAAVQ